MRAAEEEGALAERVLVGRASSEEAMARKRRKNERADLVVAAAEMQAEIGVGSWGSMCWVMYWMPLLTLTLRWRHLVSRSLMLQRRPFATVHWIGWQL